MKVCKGKRNEEIKLFLKKYYEVPLQNTSVNYKTRVKLSKNGPYNKKDTMSRGTRLPKRFKSNITGALLENFPV